VRVRIAFGAALDWNAGMSENEPEKAKKGWGCVQWSVVVVMLFMGGIVLPAYEFIAKKSNQMRAGESFRQIFHLMMTYASDHEGYFPDHDKDLSTLTANATFRSFMQEGLILDETIFGCPASRFIPDKNIGEAPNYAQALEPGENHWMMVANLSNESPGHYPMILESAADVAWPPRWLPVDGYASRKYAEWTGVLPPRGRSWADGSILVGFNDGSLQTVKLELKEGRMHLPESVLKPTGKEPLPELRILDVE
jgi:hypothetical protein